MMRWFILAACLACVSAVAQKVARFEYFGSEHGLSQNSVYSVICDDKGFLWTGTMNGLNRFDGKSFKVFKHTLTNDGSADGEPGVNGRIERIWEDERQFIWLETYDGRYRFFNQRKETFSVLPAYSSEIDDEATAFSQVSQDVVAVGTMLSGVYILRYDDKTDCYVTTRLALPSVGQACPTVLSMHTDAKSNLWIVTDKGLLLMSSEQVSREQPSVEEVMQTAELTGAVSERPQGLLFGMQKGGIAEYMFSSGKVSVGYDNTWGKGGITLLRYVEDMGTVVASSDACLSLLTDKGSVRRIRYQGQGTDKVKGVFVDRFNHLWITTHKKGVSHYSPEAGTYRHMELTPARYEGTVDEEFPIFLEDSHGQLWIGLHDGGLLRYDRASDSFENWMNDISDSKSISSDVVLSMTEDKNGELWIGTGQYLGGLVRVVMENPAFRFVKPRPAAGKHVENLVRSLMTDSAGHVWLGTKGSEIIVYEEGTLRELRTFRNFACTDGTSVSAMPYAMMLAGDGRLWVATKGQGIFVSQTPVDIKNIATSKIVFDRICRGSSLPSVDETGLSHDYVYSVCEDDNGVVWAASYGGGLYRIARKGGAFSVDIFNRKNSRLISDKVRYVMKDHEGGLWVSTVGGVNHIEPADVQDVVPDMEVLAYQKDGNSLGYNDICQIIEGRDQKLYFATLGGGLSILSRDAHGKRHFTNLTTAEGLCNNSVYALSEDKDGDVWLSTENGVARLDASSMTFEVFNSSNGLPFNSFSEATAGTGRNGVIYFGGYSGFVGVQPSGISKSAPEKTVVLTELSINNKEQSVGGDSPLKESITYTSDIELEYWQNNLNISYSALYLSDPSSVRYAYMMVGLDKDWNDMGNQDHAIYTNLQPGKYTLKIRMTLPDGTWSSASRDLRITILQPWWNTWAARAIYALIAMGIAYAIFYAIKRNYKMRHELALEKKLNEIKLQFFTNIAHEIRTPLTLIVSPIDNMMEQGLPSAQMEQMQVIRRNAGRILMLTNQLLDFRKVQNKRMFLQICQTDIGHFVTTVGDNFKLLAQKKSIEYNYDIQSDMQSVWIDVNEMDTVVYNLLSNAFKFTDEYKRITLSVRQDEQYTYIAVADQGKGMKTTDPNVVFNRYTILSSNDLSGTGIGLSLAYELVKLHKGELSVESELGKGSTFTIKLQNGNEHFNGDASARILDGEEAASILKKHNPLIETAHKASEAVDPELATNPNSPHILIVEDNYEIRDYIAKQLGRLFRCSLAGDGAEALENIAADEPDLIITDISMPVMDGQELIRRVRGDFQTSHIPIIALSARSSTDDQIATYSIGADVYVAKPFNVEHLMAIAQNLLKRREQLVASIAGLKGQRTRDAYELDEADGEQNETSESTDGAAQPLVTLESIGKEELSVNIPTKDEEFIKALVEYVEAHYKDNIGVEQYAENFNMCRTVFFNKVKSLTGQGPLEFVRKIKFKLAADLLSKGYNVSEAAYQIGYSDSKYFSKQFKQIYGYSPSQLKK